MQKAALAACALSWLGGVHAAGSVCPSTAGADPRPTFDAALLKEGRFVYRTTLRGESLGETTLEIRRDGANYRISMSAPEVGQSWQATVARSFAPIQASLSMRGRKGPYRMELRYAGDSVTGEEQDAGVTRPVDARVAGVTLDQRVDWAAMMAARAPDRSSFALRVFDPSTGSSAMLGRVGGDASTLRLDYSICKREHLEEYTVHATRETPRTMLREDMPNGLVSELIRAEP